MVSLSLLLDELETARDELVGAQAHYTEVACEVATAKANLEYRKAEMLAEGVEGSNAEQREATLRLKLSGSYAELASLERELTRVKGRLEIAQTCFTAVRYKVRAQEALREVA